MNLSLIWTLFCLICCLNSTSGLDGIRQRNVTHNRNRCVRRLYDVTYEVALDGVLACVLDLIRAWNLPELRVVTTAEEQEFDLDTIGSALKRNHVKSETLKLPRGTNVSSEIKELISRCNTLLVFGSNAAIAEITRLFQLDGLLNATQVWILGLSDPLVSGKMIIPDGGAIGSAPQYVVVSPIRDQGETVSGDRCATSVQLFDLFHGTTSGSAIKAIQFGDWTRDFGLNLWDKLKEENEDAWRLQQRLVHGITFHQPPFATVIRNDGAGSPPPSFGGYIWDIVDILSQQLNFKFEVRVVSQEAGLGTKMNNTFNGLVGELYQRKADIALTIFSMTSSRRDGMSFLFTVSNGLMGLAFRTPGKYVSPVAHVLAFSSSVWILTTVSIIVLMTFLAAANVVDLLNTNITSRITKDSTMTKARELIKWISSGDLFETNTIGKSSKVFLGTFLLLSLILSACYNSVFMAFFTYSKSPITFTNVEELLATSSFKVTLVKQTGFHDTFSNSKTGLYRQIWEKIIDDNQPLASNTLQALQALCSSSNLVLLCDVNTPAVYRKILNCHVSSIRTNHMKDFGHIGIRKDFPYNRVFFREVLRLKENGVLNRLRQRYFGFETPQTRDDENEHLSLELNHFLIPFYVISGGLVCSPVALLVEMVLERIKRNSKSFD